MSTQYVRLMDLLRRPEGCRVPEAAATLGITAAGCRGMIRDLKRLLPVETSYGPHGGRGRGRAATHFIRSTPDNVSDQGLTSG